MNNGVDIGQSVSDGWILFKENASFLIIAMVIYLVVSMVLAMIPIVNFFQIVWGGPLLGGLVYIVRDAATGAPQNYGRLFDGFRLSFGPMAIAYILVMLIAAVPIIPVALLAMSGSESWWILAIVAGVAMVLIQAIFLLTYFYIVEENKSATEAMAASKAAMSGNYLNAFLFVLVVSFIGGVGVILLGFGMLVTAPIALCIVNCAFEQFFVASTSVAASDQETKDHVHVDPVIPETGAAYKKGEVIHCFVFRQGVSFDNNEAWGVLENVAPKMIEEPHDPEVTGKGLPAWPKSKQEFMKIVTKEIERYISRVASAPDYLDKNVFKIRMRSGKEKGSGKQLAIVTVVAL